MDIVSWAETTIISKTFSLCDRYRERGGEKKEKKSRRRRNVDKKKKKGSEDKNRSAAGDIIPETEQSAGHEITKKGQQRSVLCDEF